MSSVGGSRARSPACTPARAPAAGWGRSHICACVAALNALFGTVAVAQDRAVDRGQEVFVYWCAPCHSAGPRNPGTIALEVRYQGSKPAALEERTDLVPELTKMFVRNGLSIMPPFRKTEISDADLEALAAYLAPNTN